MYLIKKLILFEKEYNSELDSNKKIESQIYNEILCSLKLKRKTWAELSEWAPRSAAKSIFFLNWLSIIKYKIVEKKTEMKLIVSWMVAT